MIIGLAGRKCVGKDTVANLLCSLTDKFKKAAFAGFLKNMCKEIFNLTGVQVDTQEGKESLLPSPTEITHDKAQLMIYYVDKHSGLWIPPLAFERLTCFKYPLLCKTPREVLQYAGDVCRGALGADIFARIVLKEIELNDSNGLSTIVSDMRFPEERKTLSDAGAYLVYIRSAAHTEGDDTHISENSFGDMSEYDLVVINDKSSSFNDARNIAEILKVKGELYANSF